MYYSYQLDRYDIDAEDVRTRPYREERTHSVDAEQCQHEPKVLTATLAMIDRQRKNVNRLI